MRTNGPWTWRLSHPFLFCWQLYRDMASLCVAVNVFPFCFSLYLNWDLACVMWCGWVCNWSDPLDVPLIVWCVIIDEIRANRLCTVPHGAPHADAVHLLSHHDKCTYHVAAMCTGCACITLHLHQYIAWWWLHVHAVRTWLILIEISMPHIAHHDETHIWSDGIYEQEHTTCICCAHTAWISCAH